MGVFETKGMETCGGRRGGASSGGLREMPIDGKSSRENTRVREA